MAPTHIYGFVFLKNKAQNLREKILGDALQFKTSLYAKDCVIVWKK